MNRPIIFPGTIIGHNSEASHEVLAILDSGAPYSIVPSFFIKDLGFRCLRNLDGSPRIARMVSASGRPRNKRIYEGAIKINTVSGNCYAPIFATPMDKKFEKFINDHYQAPNVIYLGREFLAHFNFLWLIPGDSGYCYYFSIKNIPAQAARTFLETVNP